MDPVRAAWLTIGTVELRNALFEALWWNLVAWIPLLAFAWDSHATSMVFIAPVVWLLVAFPLARLQVRVAAQQSGTEGSLDVLAFLALALGSLLAAIGAGLVFGVLGGLVVAGLQIAEEVLGHGGYGREMIGPSLATVPFTLATWAVVREFQGTALVGIARAQPWFGDALGASVWAFTPWSRAMRWLLAVGVGWMLVGLVFGGAGPMEVYSRPDWLMQKLAPWGIGLSAVGTVAWPVYLVGTTPAGARPTVAETLPKIGDDLANEITTR